MWEIPGSILREQQLCNNNLVYSECNNNLYSSIIILSARVKVQQSLGRLRELIGVTTNSQVLAYIFS